MIKQHWRFIGIFNLVVLLASCGEPAPEFYEFEDPLRLSDWNLFVVTDEALIVNAQTISWQPANPLFSDYAHKLRTLWIPAGQSAVMEDEDIQYPIGTILTKTFYYPLADAAEANEKLLVTEDTGSQGSIDLTENKLIETRLLILREDGWTAFPYVWNDDQSEAFLRLAGSSKELELFDDSQSLKFTYFVPNQNQCAACHTTVHPRGEMHPLGATALQLNSSPELAGKKRQNQLATLIDRNWLRGSVPASRILSWQDTEQTVEDRAQAYLAIHCGHCHNPDGAADTSALLLDGSADRALQLGVCKPPVAAGSATGKLRYGIVPGHADESILLARMQSTDPAIMMPELGRSLAHTEGVYLIQRWIEQMPGSC